jgi:hypothetical protein
VPGDLFRLGRLKGDQGPARRWYARQCPDRTVSLVPVQLTSMRIALILPFLLMPGPLRRGVQMREISDRTRGL